MTALYKINNEFQALIERWEQSSNDEELDLLDARLSELAIERNEKIDNCLSYYKSRNAEAVALRAEARALLERARRAEASADWVFGYVQRNLVPREAWKNNHHEVCWRRCSKLQINEGTELPPEFLRVKTEPNKEEIINALKCGKVIDGCEMVEAINMSVR